MEKIIKHILHVHRQNKSIANGTAHQALGLNFLVREDHLPDSQCPQPRLQPKPQLKPKPDQHLLSDRGSKPVQALLQIGLFQGNVLQDVLLSFYSIG